MSAYGARAKVFQIDRPPFRRIIVEPVARGLWIFRLYQQGAFTGTRCDPGERDRVIECARLYSEQTGLPAFFRGNVYAPALPMRRGRRK